MKGAQFESYIRLYEKCIHGLNVTYVRYEKKYTTCYCKSTMTRATIN